jgi:hypothetical protein
VPLVGAEVGAAGTTCTRAPAVFSTDGVEYPIVLTASTTATMSVPCVRPKVETSVSYVIGIVQVLEERIVA